MHGNDNIPLSVSDSDQSPPVGVDRARAPDMATRFDARSHAAHTPPPPDDDTGSEDANDDDEEDDTKAGRGGCEFSSSATSEKSRRISRATIANVPVW